MANTIDQVTNQLNKLTKQILELRTSISGLGAMGDISVFKTENLTVEEQRIAEHLNRVENLYRSKLKELTRLQQEMQSASSNAMAVGGAKSENPANANALESTKIRQQLIENANADRAAIQEAAKIEVDAYRSAEQAKRAASVSSVGSLADAERNRRSNIGTPLVQDVGINLPVLNTSAEQSARARVLESAEADKRAFEEAAKKELEGYRDLQAAKNQVGGILPDMPGYSLNQVGSVSSGRPSSVFNAPDSPPVSIRGMSLTDLSGDAKVIDQLKKRLKNEGASKAQLAMNDGGVKITQGLTDATTGYKTFEIAVTNADGSVAKINATFDKNGKLLKEQAAGTAKLSQEQKDAAIASNKYAAAFEQLEKSSGGMLKRDNLTNIQSDVAGNKERLTFQKQDEATGANIRQDVLVDKSGQVNMPSQRAYRSTAQNITRDIGELAKWTLAVGVIYGPLQKVGELMTQMVANEVALATATVTVNSAFANSANVFKSSADAANAAGESITSTIEAFTEAYRATGGATDETSRYTTAQKLLNDSLVLSKLSTLNQTESINTLSAAVKQTGGDFSTTTHLLDSWVRTTKVANVDMTALATGFAVLGDAADAAGISTDQLNGIVANVAETGIGTGKEVANIARSIVSGFQSDNAQAQMMKLGIAVKDSTGQLRSFMDIMGQVYNMRKQGLISDSDFSSLTLALGGGTRRQAAYATFISNFDRVYQVANESASANGDAQDALQKQLDTTATALQRLDNGFQTVAQTLGTDGGFLDIFKMIVGTGTDAVSVINSLVTSLGRATPLILTALTAFAVLKSRDNPGLFLQNNVFSPLAGGINKVAGSEPGTQSPGYRFTNYLQNSNGFSGSAGGAGIGFLTGLLPAISNFSNKEDPYGGLKGSADLIGGTLGGAIAGFLASPAAAPAGAAIGVAISEAFVNNTMGKKAQLQDFFAPVTEGDKNIVTDETRQKRLTAAKNALYSDIGGGNQTIGEGKANVTANGLQSVVKSLNTAITDGNTTAIKTMFSTKFMSTQSKDILASMGITKEDVLARATSTDKQLYTPENITKGNVAVAMSDNTKVVGELEAAIKGLGGTGKGGVPDAFTNLVKANSNMQLGGQGTSAYIDKIVNSGTNTINSDRFSNKINASSYKNKVDEISGFASTGPILFTAFGSALEKLSPSINSAEDAYQAFLDVIVNGSPEAGDQLKTIAGEISTLMNLQATLKPGEKLTKDIFGAGEKTYTQDDLQNMIKARQSLGAQITADDLLNQKLAVKPNILGSQTVATPKNDIALVQQATLSAMKEQQQQFFPTVDFEDYKSKFEDFSLYVADAGKVFYDNMKGLDPKLFMEEWQKLIDEGKITKTDNKGLDFQQYKDIDRATLEGLAKQSVSMGETWKTQFNYGGKADDQIAIAKDGVAKPIHADFKILAMLLEKIVDQNQKQIDGMFNMPDGAYFWVNLAAAQMHLGTQAAGTATSTESAITTAAGSSTSSSGNQVTPEVQEFINSEERKKKEAGIVNSDKVSDRFKSKKNKEYVDLIKDPAVPDPSIKVSDRNDRKFDEGYTPKDLGAVATSTVSSTMNLNFNWTTTLLLDGRVLATAMKSYFAADMAKATAAGGSSTKDFVI